MVRHDVDPQWVDQVVAAAPSVGPVRLVCVDGPAGAGKTTVAAALASAVTSSLGLPPDGVPVVHGDDVYEGWAVVRGSRDRVSAFDALAGRLEGWLLEPWRRGREGAHPVWDWVSDGWGDERLVPAAPVVVLEGVGLSSRALRSRAVLSVWVDADDDVLLERVLARDGESLRAHMLAWRDDENAWHRSDRTREDADVRICTT